MDVQYRNVGITYASNNCISFVKVSGLHFPFLKQVYKSPRFKALYALPLTSNTKTLYCIGQSFMLWIFRMRCQSSQIRLRKCLLCITFILKLMECMHVPILCSEISLVLHVFVGVIKSYKVKLKL